jgi:HD-like signal output (HDOD) protein
MQKEIEKKLLKRQILETTNLPTPSIFLMRIMAVLKHAEPNMKELLENIERNQTLVAQILKLVNSGFYGLRHEIKSVQHAINLLGIRNLKQVVYSAAMMQVFSKDDQADWDHSYACSVLMNEILKQNPLPVAENLPLTCLLHDIGKVVLHRYRPQNVALLNKKFYSVLNRPFHEIEQEIFCADHAEVGGWLMEHWKMTEDIIVPVREHHTRGIPENHVIETGFVQFVDWLDKKARDLPTAPLSESLMEEAGMNEIDAEAWIDHHRELLAKITPVLVG